MNMEEAIRLRHSVRRYLDKPVEAEKLAQLKRCADESNAASGLHIQMVTEEPKAFSTGIFKYGNFAGVKNYFVLAGPKGSKYEQAAGYCGEKLVLLAQTLGLNSCWVGLTYKKIPGTFTLGEGEKVHCVISFGYGENQGVSHKVKTFEQVAEAPSDAPEWFRKGVDAALLAPTAMNQQKFKFSLLPDGKVSAKATFCINGYADVDLGIAKLHFELGAGTGNFTWAE